MRKMTKILGLAVAGALALSASAQANIVLNTTQGTSGGFDYYNLYLFNNGATVAPDTGTKIQGFDVTVSTPGTGTAGAIKFDLIDWDGDGANDVNIMGTNGTGRIIGITSVLGSWMRLGSISPVNFQVDGADALYETSPSMSGSPEQSITAAFEAGTVHSWRYVVAATGTPPAAAASPGNLFGHIVVPTGTQLNITGLAAGEVGPNVVIGVPEPASLAMLALGGLLMFRRR